MQMMCCGQDNARDKLASHSAQLVSRAQFEL